MRKLGLVGGMGPESTVPYYHDIVYGVWERTKAFPVLAVESVNVFDVLGLCSAERYEELTEYLLRAIRNLAAGGAEFAALSANTPHIVFDRLVKRSPIPLVSIVEATCEEAVSRQYRKIGLLGTRFTMQGAFFKEPFARREIEIIVPDEEEMEYIGGKISDELEIGIVKQDTLEMFLQIIERMKREDGIEAIVLGCTELPLLLNDGVSTLPCLDTMKIHVRALVDEIVRA